MLGIGQCLVPLEDRVTMAIKVKGVMIHIDVLGSESMLSWAWLIREVIRLSNLNLPTTLTRKQLIPRDSRVIGVFHKKLGMKTSISSGSLYDEVASLSSSQRNFELLISGSIVLLPDAAIELVGDYLNCSAVQMSILRTVSSKWKRLFSQDKFWQSYTIRTSQWEGEQGGFYDDVADELSDLAGLPRFNALRVQWCARHSSRLRLYVGYLDPSQRHFFGKLKLALFDMFRQSPVSRPRRSLILMYGSDRVLSESAHRALISLLPPSTTCEEPQTLVPGDKLVSVEAVRALGDSKSKATTYFRVRVERGVHSSFRDTLRIAGDSRLQVVLLQGKEMNNCSVGSEDAYSSRMQFLRLRSLAVVISLPMGAATMHPAALSTAFREIYRQAFPTPDMYARTQSHSSDIELPLDTTVDNDDIPPLLVLLPIDQFDDIESQTKSVLRTVSGIVSGSSREFFVQPYHPELTKKEDLHRGFLFGINWMVRCLSAKLALVKE